MSDGKRCVVAPHCDLLQLDDFGCDWLSVSRQKEQSVRNAWQMPKRSFAKCEANGLKMRPLQKQDQDKRSLDMRTEHIAVG